MKRKTNENRAKYEKRKKMCCRTRSHGSMRIAHLQANMLRVWRWYWRRFRLHNQYHIFVCVILSISSKSVDHIITHFITTARSAEIKRKSSVHRFVDERFRITTLFGYGLYTIVVECATISFLVFIGFRDVCTMILSWYKNECAYHA